MRRCHEALNEESGIDARRGGGDDGLVAESCPTLSAAVTTCGTLCCTLASAAKPRAMTTPRQKREFDRSCTCGVSHGSPLGLELDISAFGSVQYILDALRSV